MVHFGLFQSWKVAHGFPNFAQQTGRQRDLCVLQNAPGRWYNGINCTDTQRVHGAISHDRRQVKRRATTLWASCGLACAWYNCDPRLSIKEENWQETKAQEVRRGTILCLVASAPCLLALTCGRPLGPWVGWVHLLFLPPRLTSVTSPSRTSPNKPSLGSLPHTPRSLRNPTWDPTL